MYYDFLLLEREQNFVLLVTSSFLADSGTAKEFYTKLCYFVHATKFSNNEYR